MSASGPAPTPPLAPGARPAVSSPAGSVQELPGVIAPPPLIYIGGLASGLALDALLSGPSLPPWLTWPLGTALTVGGGLLARSFLRAFASAKTPVSPYRAPSRLVTTGSYRFTRNPGYLGMALAYAGVAVLAGSVWALAPLPLVLALVDRGVIAREERYLTRLFGDEYTRYASRTRRWL